MYNSLLYNIAIWRSSFFFLEDLFACYFLLRETIALKDSRYLIGSLKS